MVPRSGIDQNQIKTAIEEHNTSSFASMNLTVESSEFDADYGILKVAGIDDKESGINYLRSLVRNQEVYGPLMEVNYRNFVISPDNYNLLLENKDFGAYLDFYKTFYLNR